MSFISALINNAKAWLDCRETSKNRSVCVDKIHKAFSENWRNDPDAWCTKFVWVVFDATCKQFNVKNPLPKTASTHELLRLSKDKFEVDRVPAVGAIMFYPTGSNTGHNAIVIEVNGNNFTTIDGNSSDKVKINNRNLKDKDFQFIHTEKLYSDAILPTNIFSGFVLFGLGIYALWKYVKK